MRHRLLATLEKTTRDVPTFPTLPSAGDVVLGCVHGPRPETGGHFFYLAGGVGFTRPQDGSTGTAEWLMICAACNARFGRRIIRAAAKGELKVGSDLVWPEGKLGLATIAGGEAL